MRALLIDDHPLFAQALGGLIQDEFGAALVVETSAGAGARRGCAEHFDLVVLDLDLGGGSGAEVLAQILSARPGARVLLCSGIATNRMAARLLKAGARGFVDKAATPESTLEALRTVMGGGRSVAPPVAACLLEGNEGLAALSDREIEVVRRLCRGQRPTEIADELGLSVKTVSTYRRRAFDKLGVHSLSELIRVFEAEDL